MKYFRLLIGLGSIILTGCIQAKNTTSLPPETPSPIFATPTISPPSLATKSISTAPSPAVTIPSVDPLPLPSIPAQVGDYQVIDELKQPQFMAQSSDILRAARDRKSVV